LNHPDLNKPQPPQWGAPPPPAPSFLDWVKAHKAVSAVGGGLAVLLVAGALANAAGAPVAVPAVPLASTSTPAVAAPPMAPSAAAQGNVPDLTGKGLPSAQTILGNAGFKAVTAHDSSNGGRMQFNDPNWKVCFQDPKPGQYPANTPIDLGVVKRAETCPAVDGTAVTAVPAG
jgi:hypothetical protein